MRVRNRSSFNEFFGTVEMKVSKDAVSAVQGLFSRFLDLNAKEEEKGVALYEWTKILTNFCRALSDAKASDKASRKKCRSFRSVKRSSEDTSICDKGFGIFSRIGNSNHHRGWHRGAFAVVLLEIFPSVC